MLSKVALYCAGARTRNDGSCMLYLRARSGLGAASSSLRTCGPGDYVPDMAVVPVRTSRHQTDKCASAGYAWGNPYFRSAKRCQNHIDHPDCRVPDTAVFFVHRAKHLPHSGLLVGRALDNCDFRSAMWPLICPSQGLAPDTLRSLKLGGTFVVCHQGWGACPQLSNALNRGGSSAPVRGRRNAGSGGNLPNMRWTHAPNFGHLPLMRPRRQAMLGPRRELVTPFAGWIGSRPGGLVPPQLLPPRRRGTRDAHPAA